METIEDYEYNRKDLLGHGAFAIVYRGRVKKVSVQVKPQKVCSAENWIFLP